jgi:hypothetical protein
MKKGDRFAANSYGSDGFESNQRKSGKTGHLHYFDMLFQRNNIFVEIKL